MSKKYLNKNGFTLMELIITIAIMAILLFIAVPAFVEYLPDTTKMMCEKNRETIMAKYDYEVSNYNRRMHTEIYDETNIISEDRKLILADIQKKVFEGLGTTLSCPKDGKYVIFDEFTIAGHVKHVNCSIHDEDNRTAEEIMLDKIRVDIYEVNESCKIPKSNDYETACLNKFYGDSFFTGMKISSSNLYKDEIIGKYLFNAYDKNWPKLDSSMFDTINEFNNVKLDDLFIRPKYLKQGTKDLVLFASNRNSFDNWDGARAVYYNGYWYKSSAVSKHTSTGVITPGKIIIPNYTTPESLDNAIKNGTLIPIEAPYDDKIPPLDY